jgi:hypothetical protein
MEKTILTNIYLPFFQIFQHLKDTLQNYAVEGFVVDFEKGRTHFISSALSRH